MKTIEDVDVEDQRILLRTDLNLPVENGEPKKTVRFERYVETVKKLRKEGAKIVVMAHQGRPARKDFLSLKKHGELLSESLNDDVKFISSFFGPELGETVAGMSSGDVSILENIRFLSEELQNVGPKVHASDFFVQRASKYFDIFVNDAFSAAHRSHGSMVGFTETLESYAGPVMKREYESCSKIRKEFDSGVLVLGGEKPSDLIGIIEEMVDSMDEILLGGIPGELALMGNGHSLGKKEKWIKEKGFDSNQEELMELIEDNREKFVLPKDVVTDSGNYDVSNIPDEITWDIGEETEKLFAEKIREADSVLMKGPMGAFEKHPDGTKAITDAIAENDGFTVLGGGHTSSLVEEFDHSYSEFSHVSIAGGAFVRFMSGESLPAIESLKK